MSIDLMNKVWNDQTEWLKGSRRLVLLALADNASDEGWCWPSQKTIARKANLGKRYVIGILEELEGQGYICRIQRSEKGLKQSTRYRVYLPPEAQQSSEPGFTTIVNQASLPSEAGSTRVVRRAAHKPPINHQLTIQQQEGVTPKTPNIFALYEANIGVISPQMADILKDAEQEYPYEWIEAAVREALRNNVRRWAYVEAILKNWQTNGFGADSRKKPNSNGHKPGEPGRVREPAGFAGIREYLRREQEKQSNGEPDTDNGWNTDDIGGMFPGF